MLNSIKNCNQWLKKYTSTLYSNLKIKLILLLVIFLLVVLDFTFKSLVVAHLKEGQEINFLSGFIQIQLVYNSGAAFGMGSSNPEIMVGLQLLLTSVIIIMWFFLEKTSYLINISLILAGALGNILDRFGNNRTDWGVIDYFRWELFPPYSIFNFADMLVVFAVISLVLSAFIYSYKEYQEQKND